MGLPRTFFGFSSTDIRYYRLMLAWKEHEHIDFDFTNCQLQDEINSEDEAYIKTKVRRLLNGVLLQENLTTGVVQRSSNLPCLQRMKRKP
jgi:hypothetical protein